MKKKRNLKTVEILVRGLPLAGAVGASLLPIRESLHQFLVLVTVIWIQVFFILECFAVSK